MVRIWTKLLVLCCLMPWAFAAARAENPADFTVSSPQDNSTFTLSEHRGKFIALHFLLKTECPYCLKMTREYVRLGKASPDVMHVFLKPDSAEEIAKWSANLNIKDANALPKIYRDADAALAKKFGVPDGYQFHGQTVHYPALILLDKSGKEVWRYLGKNNSDRVKPEEFTARLKSLSSAR